MTLLFQPYKSAETSFSLKAVPEQDGPDTVLVGKELWNFWSTAATDRTFLSIAPCHFPHGSEHPIQAISCWAVFDERTAGLSIPPDWLNLYPHIFSPSHIRPLSSQKPLKVAPAEPVCLTEVILTTLSNDSFDFAGATHSFESCFCDPSKILRQGAVYSFDPGPQRLNGKESTVYNGSRHFRVELAEPVQQGYAQKGVTRFIVIQAEDSDSGGGVTPDSGLVHEVDSESDPDGIEIDEGFLAGSLPPSVTSPPAGFQTHHPLSSPGDHISVTSDSSVDIEFHIRPLSRPIHALDDHTLYARTADLARVGVLSGDWAVAHPNHSSKHRQVRIIANDELVPTTGTVIGSPVLLFNIFQDLPMPTATIRLHASPFGSHPAFPTASNVTLARVASPFSTDRSYQPHIFQSLKTHLDQARRLVKQGDLIAIGLDSDTLYKASEPASKLDNIHPNEVEYHHPASTIHTNQVAFFIVTNLEHGVPSGDLASDQSKSSELACWVNPAITRVVQVGVEHSRVPDTESYTGAVGAISSAPEHRSHLHSLGSQSVFTRLLALASATLSRQAVEYDLSLTILLKGSRGAGKFTVSNWVAQCLGMHLFEINCYDCIEADDDKSKSTLSARFEKAISCSPSILVLRHIDAMSQTTQALEGEKEPVLADFLRERIEELICTWRKTGYPVLVIATTSNPGQVPTAITKCFKHELTFEAPSEPERLEVLRSLLMGTTLASDVSLENLATQTAAMVASDLVDLVDRAKVTAIERAMESTKRNGVIFYPEGVSLISADFEIALSKTRASHSASIGAPQIPSVSWDDVGGLDHVKSDILDTIQLPLDHPALFAEGLKKRSGILLYGPPGTGKTLLAKAVATSCSLNFFSIKGPELLNMYIGESEANVRRVFQRARDAKPCVIFFDELDSVAPKRGIHGDSGGVMDRIVSQLLAELDGISGGKGTVDVFVIGATNRPDLLDPALLRPGRFDRMLYLGVSDSRQAQINILEALTRKFRLHPDLNLPLLAEHCPFNFTGADFYALCADAMLKAMSRKAMELEAKLETMNNEKVARSHAQLLTPQYYLAEMASSEDLTVLVSRPDFDLALRDLVPSVTQSELDEYANIQKRFSHSLTDKSR